MLVSIVIPAKNEEKTLPILFRDLHRVIQEIPSYKFEIIVVDDHSTDETCLIAQANGVKIVTNDKPSGKGNALISGFNEAQGNIIIMMDADCSHRPEEISLFLEKIQQGYGLVVGSRSLGGSEEYTVIRTLGNIFLTFCFKIITGAVVTDALNGYKAFRRAIIEKYPCRAQDFEIEIELLINTLKSGYPIGEFPSHEQVRAAGEMKSRVVKHGLRFFWKIVSLGVPYRVGRFLGHC